MNRSVLFCVVVLTFLATPLSAQLHRIGVRVVNSQGEFYDTVTGATFTPRGNNYVRLANETMIDNGQVKSTHSTFNTDTYDPARAETALTTMQQDGYNTVRVWVSHACTTCIPNVSGPGLNPAYVANLVDFLNRARNHNIYVIMTIDDLAKSSYYQNLAWNGNGSTVPPVDPNIFQQPNSLYLTPAGVFANESYWTDFMNALAAANAPFDVILSYELRNELSFDTSAVPLSLSSGLVQTADGNTYDMSSASAKQQMMDSNLVVWFNAMAQPIRAVDPQGLVSSSFLVPKGPYPARVVYSPADNRVGNPYPSSINSTLDFLALHPYPGVNLDLGEFVANTGMSSYPQKPVMMGEYGAFQNIYTTSIFQAAAVLQKWQIDSCAYNFKGWLLWTWDTTEFPDPNDDMWNAMTGGLQVDAALKPISRPNPCLINDTTTTVSSNFPSSSVAGQSVRFLATVKPTYQPMPTGNVTFYADNSQLAVVPLSGLSEGVFFSTSALASGLHWMTASYAGDANDMSSNSIPVAQLVNATAASVTSSTTLHASSTILLLGQSTNLSMTITLSSGGKAGGRVSYYDGSTLIGSGTIGLGGLIPSITWTPSTNARHYLTAVFFGGSLEQGSASAQVEVDVTNGK